MPELRSAPSDSNITQLTANALESKAAGAEEAKTHDTLTRSSAELFRVYWG